MARLCSFEIRYENQGYTTLVGVLRKNNDVVCTVHFVECSFRYVSPGDVLVYNESEGT